LALAEAPDLSEFLALQRKKGPRCGMSVALAALSPEDAALVRAALAEPGIQSKAIMRWLAERGQTVSGDAVGRHRRGDCACDR
jgi:hypothetical protein